MEVILNGVGSVCLSAPTSLFIAQSCGTNLLIESEAGRDMAGDLARKDSESPSPSAAEDKTET